MNSTADDAAEFGPRRVAKERDGVKRLSATSWADRALLVRPRLVRLAQRVVLDSGEAEDVVDEAMARLVSQELGTGAVADGAKATWLSRTVLRLAIDRRRHRERRARPEWATEVSRRRVESPDPAARAERRELEQRLWRAIEQLAPRQREVLVLKEMDQRTYEEIARILEITSGAARSHGHAAREALRVAMRPYMKESQ